MYSTGERRDMIYFYGMARGNSREARRLYQEAFSNRHVPNRQTFVNVHRRAGETGQLIDPHRNCGRPRTARSVEMEERVLNSVENDPSTSTRRIAAEEGTSNSTVWEVLHEQLLHPFHIQKTQTILPADCQARLEFCHSVLRQHAEDHEFVLVTLFTDEAGFNRNGVINLHNNHHWAHENPHATIATKNQQHFSLNVWAGILGDHLIGPHFLPNRLTGALYLEFLNNDLPNLLEDVPLDVRRKMWFLQDGAPPHFSLPVRQHLNATFPRRWIGRAGPVEWAPRSPDLNPMDFFL